MDALARRPTDASLADHHHPLEEFEYVHTARKVVGVGSVGTRAWIHPASSAATTTIRCSCRSKEAQASVLERFVGRSEHPHHGQRVVVGQRLMQAASDIFLGWFRVKGIDGRIRDYYVRQLHDWKGGADVGDLLRARRDALRAPLRSDARPRARALGRPDRDRVVPGQGRRVRPGDRGLRASRTPTRTSATTKRSSAAVGSGRLDGADRPLKRTRARAAEMRARAQRVAERAETERGRHESVDAVFEMVDRDGEVGGGIMAGALAYRLFIWLLPLALVAVGGLGLDVGRSVAVAGERGEVSRPCRPGHLVGRERREQPCALVRVSDRPAGSRLGDEEPAPGAHRRAPARLDRPPHGRSEADARSHVAVSRSCSSARSRSPRLRAPCGRVGNRRASRPRWARAWRISASGCLISTRLPHRDAPWRALCRAQLLFAVGAEVIRVLTAYLIAPQASSKQGTYGALGLAAALLLGLYFISEARRCDRRPERDALGATRARPTPTS